MKKRKKAIYFKIKRIFDIFLALIGLIIAAPIMLIIAIAIKLDSPGEVFFKQERLGRGGKTFKLYKFRKFPSDWGTKGPGVTVARDARMTRVGRILERTKFDELPQLWNILKGDMSFVGPRPETLRYAHLFKGEFKKVLDYVPGIFGPNQVAFRNESAMYPPDVDPEEFYQKVLFPKKAKNDLKYFENANIFSDIMWIIKGVAVSILGIIDWRRAIGLHGKIIISDVIAVEATWVMAKFLRYGFNFVVGYHYREFFTGMWLFPSIVIPIMILLGAYRNPVRYFSFPDAVKTSIGSSVGWSLAFLVYMGAIKRNESIIIFPMGVFILLFLVLLPRVIRREIWRRKDQGVFGQSSKLLIYGAGKRGAALAGMLHYGFPNVKIVGFLDDSDDLQGRSIQGFEVLGRERDIGTIFDVHGFTQLWVSFRPDNLKAKRIVSWCNKNNVRLVIVPETEPFSSLD